MSVVGLDIIDCLRDKKYHTDAEGTEELKNCLFIPSDERECDEYDDRIKNCSEVNMKCKSHDNAEVKKIFGFTDQNFI